MTYCTDTFQWLVMCGIAICFCLKDQLIISCPLMALDGSIAVSRRAVGSAWQGKSKRLGRLKDLCSLLWSVCSTNTHRPMHLWYVWLSSNQDLQPRHVKHPQVAGPTAPDNCKALVAVPARQHHETELAVLRGAENAQKVFCGHLTSSSVTCAE